MNSVQNGIQINILEGSIDKRLRNSNIELFRIIVMIFIIAHHYVVSSGLASIDGPIFSNPLSFKSIFLLLFGMWGKTGINCFVLITGFFMCKSNITVKKYMKILLEVYFYRILVYLVFIVGTCPRTTYIIISRVTSKICCLSDILFIKMFRNGISRKNSK